MTSSEEFIDEIGDVTENLTAFAKEILNSADELMYNRKSFAIGVGLIAAAGVGFNMRHPEILMYTGSQMSMVFDEIASELGGLTTAVEVGGD